MIAKQQQARTRFYYIRQALKQLDRPGRTPQLRVAAIANALAQQDGATFTIRTDNVSCHCARIREQTGRKDLTAKVVEQWEKEHPQANNWEPRHSGDKAAFKAATEAIRLLTKPAPGEEDQVKIEELREVRGLVKKFGSNKLRTLIALLEELSQ